MLSCDGLVCLAYIAISDVLARQLPAIVGNPSPSNNLHLELGRHYRADLYHGIEEAYAQEKVDFVVCTLEFSVVPFSWYQENGLLLLSISEWDSGRP